MKVVKNYLKSSGHDYSDFGTFSRESCDYPAIAIPAANDIARGDCNSGIFICGTGIGISIVANKISGIRAAVCTSCYAAEAARRHNDANVLALGGLVIDADLAVDIVESFLSTDFSGDERHRRRLSMISELEE